MGKRSLASLLRSHVRRVNRGESGMTLVEMMVSLGIFMLFSSLFIASVVSFLRATSASRLRSVSTSSMTTAAQRIERMVRYASDAEVDPSGNMLTLYIPGEAATKASVGTTGVGQCIVLTYSPATWSANAVDTYGTLTWQSRDEGTSTYRDRGALLADLFNNATAHSTSGGIYQQPMFAMDSTTHIVSFSPVVGGYVAGRAITSNTVSRFPVGNAGADADWTIANHCS
ncbi:prepilin-type N-terminal cleavage/methylation domain-containing protein [uncultured Bifidobacterium sp.]|uniref:prepilin-type N-terminal cleavage/methylation domain-containing protein n=1 Tax=uncultured Bifidobacterium sp. TaxID=165187 RepID=UPI00258D3784|nr:prepilin-type N-terminal cleavage/methylation domain-containing protein [uncultured Bifidobacterium sp.]